MKMLKRGLLLSGAMYIGLAAGALTVEGLKVQQLTNPTVVDTAEPSFSWHIESNERAVTQQSYRVVVFSDPECAEVVWDSGTVESDLSQRIPATGINLQAATRYLPAATANDELFESGRRAAEAEGVTFEGIADGKAVFTLGSGKYSFTRTIDTGTAVAPVAETAVTVYPNPVTDSLHILTDMEIRRATVFDATGAVVLGDTFGATTLDLSALASGFYILALETSGVPATAKVIKR